MAPIPLVHDLPVLEDDQREYMMGIDEAGRGPTLGPMVYGSAFCAVDDESKLKGMGFNDSKQLTEAKREQLWEELQTCGFIGWRIRVLEAAEISEGMLRRHQKYNLNAMSHDAAIGLVKGVLATGINLRYLYVDTVGDPERYQAKLAEIFPTLKVVVEKKADSKFLVVSAASICAKVPRDHLLNDWPCEDTRICKDRDWGCGYPGDKNTVRWMAENLNPVFGWPNLVRFSWGPAAEVLDKNPQAHGVHPVRWPEEDGADATQQQQQRDSMAAFLGRANKRQKVPDRHRLLHEAMLEPIGSW
jgi:ribonuclease H2 subunit A